MPITKKERDILNVFSKRLKAIRILKIHEIQEFMTLAYLTLEIAKKLSNVKKVQKKKTTKTK